MADGDFGNTGLVRMARAWGQALGPRQRVRRNRRVPAIAVLEMVQDQHPAPQRRWLGLGVSRITVSMFGRSRACGNPTGWCSAMCLLHCSRRSHSRPSRCPGWRRLALAGLIVRVYSLADVVEGGINAGPRSSRSPCPHRYPRGGRTSKGCARKASGKLDRHRAPLGVAQELFRHSSWADGVVPLWERPSFPYG